ncbi:MAG: hypothetical protein IIA35_00195 [Proteobacteria bacterium]|nr:hypothetical protein [Pseudomonadota bacterium]
MRNRDSRPPAGLPVRGPGRSAADDDDPGLGAAEGRFRKQAFADGGGGEGADPSAERAA